MRWRQSFVIFGILIGFTVLVESMPIWVGYSVNYTLNEETVYMHNLSANISGFNNDILFSIDKDSNITWTTSSGTIEINQSVVSDWINLSELSWGNLMFSPQYDNQTGFFVIPIQAANTTVFSASVEDFEFQLNATNDKPNFILESMYNLSAPELGFDTFNLSFFGSDEELHYPLLIHNFTVTSASKASWTNQSDWNLDYVFDDSSLEINFTNLTSENVGVYNVTICVNDTLNETNLPMFRSINYDVNQTACSDTILNVQYSLNIDASSCELLNLLDNETLICEVNVTTQYPSENITFWSNATLGGVSDNYVSEISGRDWVYSLEATSSENYHQIFKVNVSLNKTFVGNWTINFSVNDSNKTVYDTANLFINMSQNDLPILTLGLPNNNETSSNFAEKIYYNVTDSDFIIPDKSIFDEKVNVIINIYNSSNLTEEVYWSNFTNKVVSYELGSGSDMFEYEISFTPNSSQVGEWTINFTYFDLSGVINFQVFNLTILDNSPPRWEGLLGTNYTFDEDSLFYLNLSQNVSDSEGDELTFSFINYSTFDSFSLDSETGIINFTPRDIDVGDHVVDITVSDGHLTNTTRFNFTIINIPDDISVYDLVAGGEINETEDEFSINFGEIVYLKEDAEGILWLKVQDDDLAIPTAYENYYNESIDLNLTIEGINSNLFLLNLYSFEDNSNQVWYLASFTPSQSDLGGDLNSTYNISINVSDKNQSSSDVFNFTLILVRTEEAPNVDSLKNQTIAVNQSLLYDINASDDEDGNDTLGNLVFSYNFLEGEDFINFSELIFNTTSGLLNYTFNDTQGGRYHVNISVNDTSNLIGSNDFWIEVYDTPQILTPTQGSFFNDWVENVTFMISFGANHSMGTNLTYHIYLNGSLKYNFSALANSTNNLWNFTPNFTEETGISNSSLLFFIFNPLYPFLNISQDYEVSISHANAPVVFSGSIPNLEKSYDDEIFLSLGNYFSDIDNSDPNYNQTLNFSVFGGCPNNLSCTFENLTAVFSTSLKTEFGVNLSILANDSLTSVQSNTFWINFTKPTTEIIEKPKSSSGGSSSSGTTSKSAIFKIYAKGVITAKVNDPINIPFTLENNASKQFNDLVVFLDVQNSDGKKIQVNSKNLSFSTLKSSSKLEDVIGFEFLEGVSGDFEVKITARSGSPFYEDEVIVYLTVENPEIFNEEDFTNLEKFIVFTEEFIVQNPECLELRENLEEAKNLAKNGDIYNARLKTEEVLESCESFISQPTLPKLKFSDQDQFFIALIFSTILAFLAGFGYYQYNRIKLKKRLNF